MEDDLEHYCGFFITLDPSRLPLEFQALSAAVPFNVMVWQGHDGTKTYADWKKSRKFAGTLGPGGYGAFVSHIQVWQELVSSNFKGAIIFEDDAVSIASPSHTRSFLENLLPEFKLGYLNLGRISPPLSQTLRQSPHFLRNTWGGELLDLVRLKFLEKAWKHRVYRPKAVKNQHLNMHAYYIAREFAEVLLSEFNSPLTFIPVDELLMALSRVSDFGVRELEPPIFKVSGRESIISKLGR